LEDFQNAPSTNEAVSSAGGEPALSSWRSNYWPWQWSDWMPGRIRGHGQTTTAARPTPARYLAAGDRKFSHREHLNRDYGKSAKTRFAQIMRIDEKSLSQSSLVIGQNPDVFILAR
jgi:hypothetical protein